MFDYLIHLFLLAGKGNFRPKNSQTARERRLVWQAIWLDMQFLKCSQNPNTIKVDVFFFFVPGGYLTDNGVPCDVL